jgi:TolB protein
MTKLLRFALAVPLAVLVPRMAAGPGQAADQCVKDDDCHDANPCTKDKCNNAGQCEFKPHDFGNHYGQPIACDDGNACTTGDSCHAGLCAGANVPDDTACNDGDACTRADSCQAGACTGADPVVCVASDQCHEAGTCNPASGACSDPAAPDGTACTDTVSCSGADVCHAGVCGHNGNPRPVIVFGSGRDWAAFNQLRLEIYLMDGNFMNPERLTDNLDADSMPTLSPDGKGRIVFDSNRLRIRGVEPLNTSDLFLMKDDGSLQTFLVRGSSATWSPDSQSIAFHRSASGTGQPDPRIPDLGAPTTDSDIFVARVCDLVAGLPPTNITNSPDEIDDDPSWSPDGQKILWTAHDPNVPNYDPLVRPSQEIYVMNADGTGRVNLTNSPGLEERGPSWSPDGTLIAYMCRIGKSPTGGPIPTFEICVMNADGSGFRRLINDDTLPVPMPRPDGTPTWSPDGTRIVWNKGVPPPNQQLHVMNADGSGQTQMTFPPGFNLFASFGEIKDR